MKRKLVLALFSFVCLVAFSQELGTYQKIDLGINGLSLSMELPVAEKVVIEPAIGFGPSYDFHEDDDGLTQKMSWHWALLEPSFHGSIYGKYIYNRNKRAEKGKSLLFNSGNFIGLKAKYVSMSLSDPAWYSNTLLLNLNWGGQYSITKHWFYSYSVGVGYGLNLDNTYGMFYPAFDLKIGYVLPFFSKGK